MGSTDAGLWTFLHVRGPPTLFTLAARAVTRQCDLDVLKAHRHSWGSRALEICAQPTIVCLRCATNATVADYLLFASHRCDVVLSADGYKLLHKAYKIPLCDICYGLFKASVPLCFRARPGRACSSPERMKMVQLQMGLSEDPMVQTLVWMCDAHTLDIAWLANVFSGADTALQNLERVGTNRRCLTSNVCSFAYLHGYI